MEDKRGDLCPAVGYMKQAIRERKIRNKLRQK